MKKLTKGALIAMTMFIAASCSGDAEKAVAILKEGSARVEQAKTLDEVNKIRQETTDRYNELDIDQDDLDDNEQRQVVNATVEFMATCWAKEIELGKK